MKARRSVWWILLLASHVAVFLAARPAGPPMPAGGGDKVALVMQAPETAPAKASIRSRGGRPAKPASAHTGLLAELDASDLKGQDYKDARLAIFRDWIKRDLRGALLAMYGPEAGTRNTELGFWQRLSAEDEKMLMADAIPLVCDKYRPPGEIFQELSGIARPSVRLAALQEAGERIGNGVGMLEALGTLPRGAELDAFIEGMVSDGDHAISPETLAVVLGRVSGAELKQKLEERQVK